MCRYLTVLGLLLCLTGVLGGQYRILKASRDDSVKQRTAIRGQSTVGTEHYKPRFIFDQTLIQNLMNLKTSTTTTVAPSLTGSIQGTITVPTGTGAGNGGTITNTVTGTGTGTGTATGTGTGTATGTATGTGTGTITNTGRFGNPFYRSAKPYARMNQKGYGKSKISRLERNQQQQQHPRNRRVLQGRKRQN